ncbi:hypothetical protein CXF68_15500 [Tenacibaculum sp. Bg11-29]|uniref:putative adhesin n=1 Tax=Tenacibaculum sp. Bg11-29 TaxID=2058306 RepID=UPI000C31EB73|nr:hypothetical protein [Tenacibaculum sp. Bg11-29]PKH52009.1 hypothetical protein CXF68_15500 [Tenacibaculum sp. Bg11-29]
MPNQIIDFGDFVVWRASGNHYATSVFICSHGGYDDQDGMFNIPDYGSGKPNMYFYGAHGESIIEGKCNRIIESENPINEAISIVGAGSSTWNYKLSEYPRDWFEAATQSAVKAKEDYNVLHDCLMIKGSSGIVTLRSVIDKLEKEGVKYLDFNYMACRSLI